MLFAFFILVFFTSNLYSDLQWNLDENKDLKNQLEKLDTKLDKLNTLKNNLDNGSWEDSKIIKKFNSSFSEDEIILYINDYVEAVIKEDKNVVLSVENISFSENKKSELWFNYRDINLKMKVASRDYLENVLNYLTSDINKYSFFIDNFNFDIEKSWPYTIEIPLRMYTK